MWPHSTNCFVQLPNNCPAQLHLFRGGSAVFQSLGLFIELDRWSSDSQTTNLLSSLSPVPRHSFGPLGAGCGGSKQQRYEMHVYRDGRDFVLAGLAQLHGPMEWSCLPNMVHWLFAANGTMLFTESFHGDDRGSPVAWNVSELGKMFELARLPKPKPFGGYGPGSTDLLAALRAFPVAGLTCLVVGSAVPWVEAILLSKGISVEK